MLLALTGCADLTYTRLHLRAAPTDYANVLPAETSRRTNLGLCHYAQDMTGRSDAIVVLLASDRRIAGKLRATRVERNWGLKTQQTFELIGELDPELSEGRAAGPIDTLRAIARDLQEYRGEKLATDAHRLVVAGLVRLMQRWPRVEDVGVASTALPELFESAPGGGVAEIAVDEKGVYHFRYRLNAMR